MPRRKKNETPTPEERSPLSNVGGLNQAITDAFGKILEDERECDRMVEQHVKPIKDNITKAFRNLKADTTISITDIKLAYKLWKRQQDALDGFVEEDDRDKVIDDLRTLFNALRAGEMLNFLDVLEGGAEHVPGVIAQAEAEVEAGLSEEDAEEDAGVG